VDAASTFLVAGGFCRGDGPALNTLLPPAYDEGPASSDCGISIIALKETPGSQ
jgi:hypothetical protein